MYHTYILKYDQLPDLIHDHVIREVHLVPQDGCKCFQNSEIRVCLATLSKHLMYHGCIPRKLLTYILKVDGQSKDCGSGLILTGSGSEKKRTGSDQIRILSRQTESIENKLIFHFNESTELYN